MKNIELFIKALNTLGFSWGGDTPPEAVWGINEMLDFYEEETGKVIGLRMEEENSDNFETIISILREQNP